MTQPTLMLKTCDFDSQQCILYINKELLKLLVLPDTAMQFL